MNDRQTNLFRRDIRIQESNTHGFAPGGAIILCALAALCIVVLNLMAVVRVGASERLSAAAANETALYYQACLDANTAIANASHDGFSGVLDQTYRISDAQALHIEVSIENGAYEIREWKSVSTGDWDPDQTIDVAK